MSVVKYINFYRLNVHLIDKLHYIIIILSIKLQNQSYFLKLALLKSLQYINSRKIYLMQKDKLGFRNIY